MSAPAVRRNRNFAKPSVPERGNAGYVRPHDFGVRFSAARSDTHQLTGDGSGPAPDCNFREMCDIYATDLPSEAVQAFCTTLPGETFGIG
jgi:hypothetical protein